MALGSAPLSWRTPELPYTLWCRLACWKRALSPLAEAVIDIGLLFAAWLAAGVSFYYYCDEDWSLDYAVFFAVNAGLGVGYGDYVPDRPVTKVFTVCFSVVGTSLIMGGLGIFFEMLTTQAKAHSFERRRTVRVCGGRVALAYADLRLLLLGALYAACLLVGVWIGFEFQGYDDFADALLFSVGNYTTCGLLSPRSGAASLLWTSASLVVGVPANALFWGEVASRYFARVQRKARHPSLLAGRRLDTEDGVADDDRSEPGGSSMDALKAAYGAAGQQQQRAALDVSEGGLVIDADDPFVEFLQRELIQSGLVTIRHLDRVRTMFVAQGDGAPGGHFFRVAADAALEASPLALSSPAMRSLGPL